MSKQHIFNKRAMIVTIVVIVSIVLSVIMYIFATNEIIVVKSNMNYEGNQIGIIDTYLFDKYDNVIYKEYLTCNKKKGKSHGDLLITFLNEITQTSHINFSYAP